MRFWFGTICLKIKLENGAIFGFEQVRNHSYIVESGTIVLGIFNCGLQKLIDA